MLPTPLRFYHGFSLSTILGDIRGGAPWVGCVPTVCTSWLIGEAFPEGRGNAFAPSNDCRGSKKGLHGSVREQRSVSIVRWRKGMMRGRKIKNGWPLALSHRTYREGREIERPCEKRAVMRRRRGDIVCRGSKLGGGRGVAVENASVPPPVSGVGDSRVAPHSYITCSVSHPCVASRVCTFKRARVRAR